MNIEKIIEQFDIAFEHESNPIRKVYISREIIKLCNNAVNELKEKSNDIISVEDESIVKEYFKIIDRFGGTYTNIYNIYEQAINLYLSKFGDETKNKIINLLKSNNNDNWVKVVNFTFYNDPYILCNMLDKDKSFVDKCNVLTEITDNAVDIYRETDIGYTVEFMDFVADVIKNALEGNSDKKEVFKTLKAISESFDKSINDPEQILDCFFIPTFGNKFMELMGINEDTSLDGIIDVFCCFVDNYRNGI